MGTPFRVLCLCQHPLLLRLHAFPPTPYQRQRSQRNEHKHDHGSRAPKPPYADPGLSVREPPLGLSTEKTRTYQWWHTRPRELKIWMREHCAPTKTKKMKTTTNRSTKQGGVRTRRSGGAAVGPEMKNMAEVMRKYRENDANEEEGGEEEGGERGKWCPTTIWMDSGCSVKPLSLSPTLRLDVSWELWLAVFPVVISPATSSTDRTRSARVALARALVHPAEPDYILRIVVSIVGHQHASDADDAGNAHTITFGGTYASSIWAIASLQRHQMLPEHGLVVGTIWIFESGREPIPWWLLGYGVRDGKRPSWVGRMALIRYAPREDTAVVTRLRILGRLNTWRLGLVVQQERKCGVANARAEKEDCSVGTRSRSCWTPGLRPPGSSFRVLSAYYQCADACTDTT